MKDKLIRSQGGKYGKGILDSCRAADVPLL